MDLKNSSTGFGLVSKLIHWVMALSILALIAIALYMDTLPRGPEKFQLIGIHKSIGFLMIFAIALRLVWYAVSRPPQPLGEGVQLTLAKLGHLALYALMIFMPISGALMSLSAGYAINVFGWFEIAGFAEKNEALNEITHTIHSLGAKALYAVLIAHIGAALYHHFFMKDDTLKRMTHG